MVHYARPSALIPAASSSEPPEEHRKPSPNSQVRVVRTFKRRGCPLQAREGKELLPCITCPGRRCCSSSLHRHCPRPRRNTAKTCEPWRSNNSQTLSATLASKLTQRPLRWQGSEDPQRAPSTIRPQFCIRSWSSSAQTALNPASLA